jgi:hypothetical protein
MANVSEAERIGIAPQTVIQCLIEYITQHADDKKIDKETAFYLCKLKKYLIWIMQEKKDPSLCAGFVSSILSVIQRDTIDSIQVLTDIQQIRIAYWKTGDTRTSKLLQKFGSSAAPPMLLGTGLAFAAALVLFLSYVILRIYVLNGYISTISRTPDLIALLLFPALLGSLSVRPESS